MGAPGSRLIGPMSGPPPALAATRLAVRTACADLNPGDLVLVACSGGADSLALAAATAWVAARIGVGAGAVIVDHGLQAGSDVIAGHAREQCADLGLDPVVVRPVQVPGGTAAGGPEAAARQARYDALESFAVESGARAVLVGHTADDQAETVLLGMARGSGARSLAGMRPRSGLWRRPFLHLRRAQTEAACHELALDPWQDPTNAGRPGDPLRSRVRADVIPVLEGVLGPGVVQALARTADLLREDDDFLTGLAAEAREHLSGGEAGSGALGRLDVAMLRACPPPVRARVIRGSLLGAGVPGGSLRREHVLAVDRLVTQWHGQGPIQVPGRIQVSRHYGTLVLERSS